MPPEIAKLPGRPKDARQKIVEEERQMTRAKAQEARIVHVKKQGDGSMTMSRKGLMSDYKCRLCGAVGHNRRSCPERQSAALTSNLKPAPGITYSISLFITQPTSQNHCELLTSKMYNCRKLSKSDIKKIMEKFRKSGDGNVRYSSQPLEKQVHSTTTRVNTEVRVVRKKEKDDHQLQVEIEK